MVPSDMSIQSSGCNLEAGSMSPLQGARCMTSVAELSRNYRLGKRCTNSSYRRVVVLTTFVISTTFLNTAKSFTPVACVGNNRKITELFAVDTEPPIIQLRSKITPFPLGVETDFADAIIAASARDANSIERGDHENQDEEASEYEYENENDNSDRDFEKAQRLERTKKTAGLLSQRSSGERESISPDGTTSVGARKVGSATKARAGARSMTRLADALRKGASANTKGKNPAENFDENIENLGPAQASTAEIHSTVQDMLATGTMGLFGESTSSSADVTKYEPAPGTVLVPSAASTNPWKGTDRVSVRVASTLDDLDIANLRLSVFSDFAPDMRRTFCARSCQVLSSRRNRGATCIVATVPRYGSILSPRSDIILGTAECSFHEFEGTSLGRRRHRDAILYITEVAVSPTARRKGIGMKIMKGIDELAAIRGVETVYLHVDVANYGALGLYQRAGYTKVPSYDPIYLEFTKSLNLHDGATKGRNHYLMQKNFRHPTWLPATSEEIWNAQRGLLGFEVHYMDS